MHSSELEGLEKAIFANLDMIFGADTVGADLPEFVNQSIAWIICELAPALSPATFRNIRPAVAYLYPPNPHYPFDPTEEPPADAEPPNWRQVAALLRLWALLISDDAHVCFQTISGGDCSPLDAFLVAEGFESPVDDRRKLRFILDTVLLLRQAQEQVLQAKVAVPVLHLGKQEINQLADQWKSPNPSLAGYDLLYNHLLLAIDPYHDLENILAAVRQAVEEYHAELSRNHAANWNDEERQIFGEAHIEGTDPVKGFTYKGWGDKSRKAQTSTGLDVEALLVFALLQTMTPKEINERFFPLRENDKDAATRPKTKFITDRKQRAARLIRNAQSGTAMQV